MMVIIQLPAAGLIPEQVKTVVEILDQYVPVPLQKGIQVLCPRDLAENFTSREYFLATMKLIPITYINTFHSAISAHKKDSKLNLLSPESIDYYCSLAEIIKKAGGEVLVIHCNCVFDHTEWKYPLTDYKYIQQNGFAKIMNNLRQIAARVNIKIAIENMPFPLKGDVTSEPEEIPFDPLLLTTTQMIEFLQQLPNNIALAFDTSHYGISREKIDYLWKKYGTLTLEEINREGLKGIYPEMIQEPLSVLDAFNKIQEQTNRILHLQLADHYSTWFPNKVGFKAQQFEEGYIIGEGILGQELFALCSTIAEKYPHIPISLDVHVTDYLQRPEQVQSLKRVVGFLQQLH